MKTFKAILFILGLILMTSCHKPEEVTPVPIVKNNNNNTTLPTKHGLVLDSSQHLAYWVADTTTLRMYSDPLDNYHLHIIANGTHGGSINIRIDKALLNNQGTLPVGSFAMGESWNISYITWTSPGGKVYTDHTLTSSFSQLMTYPGSNNHNFYAGIGADLKASDGSKVNLTCSHMFVAVK